MKNKKAGLLLSLFLLVACMSCVFNQNVSESTDLFSSPDSTSIKTLRTTSTIKITVSQTIFSTPTNIPSSTVINTLTPTNAPPSPTLAPTYTTDERNDHLIELLELNGDCEFPCYWGFIPGTTKWADISRFLAYMGDSSPWETTFQGNPYYSTEYQNERDHILIATDYYVKDNVNDFIISQVIVRNNSKYLNKFEDIYSVHQILSAYGKPSRILVELLTGEVEFPSSTILFLWLFYDQKGFAILYMLKAEKADLSYETCPNKSFISSNSPLQFELIMQAPNNTRPLERIYTLLGMKISGYLSLNKATGLDTSTFYDLVISGDQSACISTPRNIWP